MTSDSLNTDHDLSEQVSGQRPRISRYEDSYDPNAENDPDLASVRADWKYGGNPRSETEMSLSPFGMVWPGVVLASACCPIVIAGVMLIYGLFYLGLPWLEFGLVLSFLVIGFFVGMISGVIMSIPAFVLTQFLYWSFNGILSTRGATVIFGGMTGFLCVFLGIFISDQGIPADPDWQTIIATFLVVLVSVAMGYVGAYWAGFLGRYDDFPFFEPILNVEKQITIGFLFRLTLMVAVLAVIFKAAGLYIGITWLAYLLVQLFLLLFDHWITRWLSRRARAKYRRALISGRR